MSQSLLGREREIRVVTDLLDRGQSHGGALMVVGDPGIGKTSLLDVAQTVARARSMAVLYAIGVESEAQMPFAGLHQLLHPVLELVDGLPVRQRTALLSAFGLAEAARPDPFLVSLAAGGLLMALAARQPVLVVADDVQWLDPQTHETLAFMARKVTTAPIVILGAVRSGYGGAFVTTGVSRLDLDGLDREASYELLRRRAPDLGGPERRRLQEQALGNPLALLELPIGRHPSSADADSNPRSVPARLEAAFAHRFGELEADVRNALLVAAVDSSDELTEILAATARLQRRTCGADVLTAAVDAHLVSVSDMTVRFRHPLVRSAVLQSETMTRQQEANAALAEVLTGEDYRRTWHRAQSIVGPDDEIADELEACVATALDRGAVVSAIRSMERAAHLTSSSALRGHRLLVAAQHAFSAGRADLVHQYLQEAIRSDLSDLDLARVQWLGEIFSDGVPGDAPRVLELCDTARRAAMDDDVDLALDLLLGAALRCWWADAGIEAHREVVEATIELTQSRAEPRYIAALAVAEPVLRGAEVMNMLSSAPVEGDADALRHLGMAAHAVGDPVRASRLLAAAEDELREDGRLALLAQVLGMHVNIQLELGDLRGADESSAECLRLSDETGLVNWNTGAVAVEARSHALRGNTERALDLAASAEMSANRQMLNDYLCCVQAAKGVALLALGSPGAAYAELRRMFDAGDPSYHDRERFIGIAFLADAARDTANAPEARRILDGLESVAKVTPSPLLDSHLRYARAVLEEGPNAETLFVEAMNADFDGWPWALARLQLAYGRWLLDHDSAAAATAHLGAARSYFADAGAAPWAAEAAALLKAARPATRTSLDGTADE